MPKQRVPRGAGESLRPEEKLRRRADFIRCYERGRRREGPLATLYVVDREPGATVPRLGITVTRRVGSAVIRHRTKRRIREIYRRWSERNRLGPYDLLVHAKPAARRADFHDLRREILRLLRPLVQRGRRAG